MEQDIIPIFFASDDEYIPFLGVAIRSLIDNASKEYNYKITILNEGLKEENKDKIIAFENENFEIDFINISEKVNNIKKDLSLRLRDYYSNSIYYRIFIPSLFPNYNKVIYLDADIIVTGDISKLFFEELDNNLVGAIPDDIVNTNDTFIKYANIAIGIEAQKYFNSGVLLMNLKEFRNEKIEEKFLHLLRTYNFKTIAPDQDYLNYLCQGRVKYIHKGWDRMATIEDKSFDESSLCLIHFNMFQKPWNYLDVPYEQYFWEYAKKTCFYEEVSRMRDLYTQEEKEKDKLGGINLENLALEIIEEKNTFHNVLDKNYFENF